MNEFYAILIGLLVRIGLPVLLTGGLIHLLSRLDAHWQEQAAHQQVRQPAAMLQPPCWEQKGCSAECTASCPAAKSAQPCWQTFRESNGYLAQKCLDCEVFRSAPVPATS